MDTDPGDDAQPAPRGVEDQGAPGRLGRRGLLRGGGLAGLALGTVAVEPTADGASASGAGERARPYVRTLPAGWTYPVAEELLPFGHGVMSGDPLADRDRLRRDERRFAGSVEGAVGQVPASAGGLGGHHL